MRGTSGAVPQHITPRPIASASPASAGSSPESLDSAGVATFKLQDEGVKRRLFKILPSLSLLLCAAVVVLWVRSRVVLEQFVLWRRTDVRWGDVSIWSGAGELSLTRSPLYVEGRYRLWLDLRGYEPQVRPILRREMQWLLREIRLGASTKFGFMFTGSTDQAQSEFAVAVTYWLLASISGLPPLLWMWCVFRRRGQDAFGLCPACGYDLRATPQRCPERGAATT
jgi:hypothetical protein